MYYPDEVLTVGDTSDNVSGTSQEAYLMKAQNQARVAGEIC